VSPKDISLTQHGQPQRENLPFTAEVERATNPIRAKIRASKKASGEYCLTTAWATVAPYIHAIQQIKQRLLEEQGLRVAILAHKYMNPYIYYGIADYQGDSLMLAQEAARSDADVIVQCGVHFMAETSKILSPDKTVLIGSKMAGCSLADAIKAEQLLAFKKQHEDELGRELPIVTYVNSDASVKAVSTVTCTSSNAEQVVRWAAKEFVTDVVLMAPDKYLARNIQHDVIDAGIEIRAYDGSCIVHERFTPEDVMEAREQGFIVLAHPECPRPVTEEVMKDPSTGFVGSTKQIHDFVRNAIAAAEAADAPMPKFAVLTECSMSSEMQIEFPQVEFAGACNYCPHMQRITVENTYYALRSMLPEFAHERHMFEVDVAPEHIEGAQAAIEKMIDLSGPPTPSPLACE